MKVYIVHLLLALSLSFSLPVHAAPPALSDLIDLNKQNLTKNKSDYLRAKSSTQSSSVSEQPSTASDWYSKAKKIFTKKNLIPSVEFAPGPKISFSYQATGSLFGDDFFSGASLTEKKNAKGPIGSLAHGLPATNKLLNYLDFKCNAERDHLSRQNSVHTKLSASIGNMLDELEKTQSDVKKVVSNQVASFFASIQQLVSPEMAMELIFRFVRSQIAQYTCKVCSINQFGCDGVFLIANFLKIADAELTKVRHGEDKAIFKQIEVEKGSYVDLAFFSVCPILSIVKGPSGVGRSVGSTVFKDRVEKIRLAAKAAKQTHIEYAMETCIDAEEKKVTSWIADVISKLISTYELSVLTQKKCSAENLDKNTVFDKNSAVGQALQYELFSGINKQISRINKISQRNTKSAVEYARNMVSFGPPTSIKQDDSKELAFLLEKNSAQFPVIAELDMNVESAKKYVFSEYSTSQSKAVVNELIADIKNFQLVKGFYKKEGLSLETTARSIPKGSALGETDTIKKITTLREVFFRNLDFYENEFWRTITTPPSWASTLYESCSSFDLPESPDITEKMCFFRDYMFEIDYPHEGNRCDCASSNKAIRLFTPPTIKANHLLEDIEEPIVVTSGTAPDRLSDYKSELLKLEKDYIVNIAAFIIKMETAVSPITHKMSIEEQIEVKRLYFNAANFFK